MDRKNNGSKRKRIEKTTDRNDNGSKKQRIEIRPRMEFRPVDAFIVRGSDDDDDSDDELFGAVNECFDAKMKHFITRALFCCMIGGPVW